MSASERSRLIYKLADLMEDHKEALAQLDTLDNGKPIGETTNADVLLQSITSVITLDGPLK